MSFLRLHLVAAHQKVMNLFRKKTQQEVPSLLAEFPAEQYEPVIRASICTGEKTACMRDRSSGKLHEVMLIRTEEDLDSFCRLSSISRQAIRTVY